MEVSHNIKQFYHKLPILVTGGAGFIGSHLAEELITYGAQVTILDDLSTGSLANIEPIRNKVTFIHGSITDFNTCTQATWNQKIIFHLAALTCVQASMGNPRLCMLTNGEAVGSLLEAAHINHVERFIFSSSASVYGNTHKPCSEYTPCNPISPYGYSKLMGEFYCKYYAHLFNLKTVILRYFNVYGDRQKNFGASAPVIAHFKAKLSKNEPITIFGDGSQTRDFIHVSKIVEANIALALLAHNYSGDIINVASGKSLTLLELISTLKHFYPEYNQEIIFEPTRKGDIQHSYANCTKYQSIELIQPLLVNNYSDNIHANL